MTMSNIQINEVTWGDPPPSSQRPYGNMGPRPSALRNFAELLKLRPGVWARYPGTTKSGYSTSTFVNMGITDVEITTRVVYINGERRVESYGRYVGQPAAASQVA